MKLNKLYGNKLLEKELKKSYKFFIKESNLNKNSLGYGLIRDKTIIANSVASIASVGYGLAALIIGVEHKWRKFMGTNSQPFSKRIYSMWCRAM